MQQSSAPEKHAGPLLTFGEAMRYLRVSRSTLYRLMWAGKIKAHKVGTMWRFYSEDVYACVEDGPSIPTQREYQHKTNIVHPQV